MASKEAKFFSVGFLGSVLLGTLVYQNPFDVLSHPVLSEISAITFITGSFFNYMSIKEHLGSRGYRPHLAKEVGIMVIGMLIPPIGTGLGFSRLNCAVDNYNQDLYSH